MKRNILHILWAAAVIPLALASCRQEVVPGETDGSDAQPFLITVTDGGYAAEATDGSRATENGYTTTFTAGDQCGLYIVRGTEIVYNNVCLIATDGTDGSLVWQAPAGTDLYGGVANERYFLYYPYQEDMEGNVTVTDVTTDDAAFFAPLISDWQPKADQSDYVDYTASDLMTATGTASYADGKLSLSFPMTHRMAMAVIEMPGTVYKFSNTPAVPDYTIAASADFSRENKPCLMSDGSYRYLVNPEVPGDNVILAGSYDNGNKEFTITPSVVTTGKYKTYKVDGGYKEIEHNLQAGDFYLKDGTLLSEDTPLTDAQKAACVGIVCWVGDATATDPVLKRDFPQCKHGLVVSLKETTSSWQEIFDSNLSIQLWAENQEFYTQGGYYALNKDVGSGYDSPGSIQGYNNTQILKAYNDEGSYPVTILNSLGTITEVTLPEDKTSGWYLPSPKELVELHSVMEAVNPSLTASGSNPLLPSPDFPYYWSSGEDIFYGAWQVNLSNGRVRSVGKASSCYVRLVFAF